jgi:predicted PurR-regulated permease PerM
VGPLATRGLLPAEAGAALGPPFQALLSSVQGLTRSAHESLAGLLSGLVGALFMGVSVFVIALYLVGDAPRLRAGFLDAAPKRYRADAQELWETLGRSLARMMVAALVSNTIQGAVAFVGLSLLGIPLAGLLAAVMWLTAFVPIAGAWLGGIPAFLVALTVSPAAALQTALLYLAINLLDGNVLTPRLQGQALTVHPVIILVAVIAAGQLFGLVGILVMLPLLATGRVIAGFLLRRLRLRHQSGRRQGSAGRSNRRSQTAAQRRPKRSLRGP